MDASVRRILVLCTVIFFSGCAFAFAQSNQPESYNCIIEPQMTIKLASPVEGVIKSVLVERGDIVRAGQVLATLEADMEQANVALARVRAGSDAPLKSARARHEFLRKKYGRSSQLRERSIVAEATLDEVEAEARVAEQQAAEAETNLELARIELQRAQVLLDQRSIKSPVDGVVIERTLLPGEFRNAQSPIMTLAKLDPLRVETFLPSRLIEKIQLGQSAEVTPDAPLNEPHRATVTIIDRVLDAASGTFGVRLSLSNPDLSLPGGLRCQVKFLTGPVN